MTDELINWTVLNFFADQPHPAIHDVTLPEDVPHGVGEVLTEAKVAHHLLSLAQIPLFFGNDGGTGLHARMFWTLRRLQRHQEVLARIAARHVRETAPGGLVGDYCAECGQRSPCETFLLATGQLDENEAEKS